MTTYSTTDDLAATIRHLQAELAAAEAQVAKFRKALDTEPLYDPTDRITTMSGVTREPRTPADYVEAYRNRLLAKETA